MEQSTGNSRNFVLQLHLFTEPKSESRFIKMFVYSFMVPDSGPE